jgi:hypothetical protein
VDFSDLINKGQLKKEETAKADIAGFLQFAEEEISAAKFNLEKFPLTAYKSAFFDIGTINRESRILSVRNNFYNTFYFCRDYYYESYATDVYF